MEERAVVLYARVVAIQAEIEAMRWDNELRKMQGLDTFNYPPESFSAKAHEVESAINEMYKY